MKNYLLFILLRGGGHVPFYLPENIVKSTIQLLGNCLNKPEEPEHKFFKVFNDKSLIGLVLVSEIQAFYVREYAPTAAEKMASALEKHLTQGESWRDTP